MNDRAFPTPNPHAAFDTLLDALADGTITDEQFAELQTLIRDDAKLRRRYIEHAALCADLHGIADEANTIEAEPIPMAKLAPSTDQRALGGRVRTPLYRYAAAAVLFIVASLVAVLATRTTSPTGPGPVAPPSAAALATLTGAENAQWAAPAGELAVGDTLGTAPLTLEGGVAELVHGRGAQSTLFGPTELRLTSDNACALRTGWASFNVPPAAHGFAVETYAGRVTDLGTRFILGADASGDVHLRVTEGVVSVSQNGSDRRFDAPVSVTLRKAGGIVAERGETSDDAYLRHIAASADTLQCYAMRGATGSTTLNNLAAAGGHAVVLGDASRAANDRWGRPALDLGGTSYLRVPVDGLDSDELTVTAWVYWRGGGAWQRVFDFGHDVNRYLFLTLGADDGRPRFAITNSGKPDEQMVTAPSPMPVERWVHLAVTIRRNADGAGSTATLYLDGKPVAQNTRLTVTPRDVAPVTGLVGKSFYDVDPSLNGVIDQFIVVRRAWSEQQIKMHYSLGKVGQP
ncbi:MAG: hypothetical protein GC159_01920 [Phycisphaera sp.]|nr:hypothetical protein [Phycisphaera sp.]